jgi:hypothetical protein
MLFDLTFIVLCFLYFSSIAAIIIIIDFVSFAITGKSLLCAIEKFLFEKFGQ